MSLDERVVAGGDPNFAQLDSRDAYARYFNLLSATFTRLLACHRAQVPNETYEVGIVPGYLQKLLHTIEALRMKYTYDSAARRALWVDLTESGFPNSMELGNLAQDLLHCRERLRELPVTSVLKRAVLDQLFQDKQDPTEMLSRLSERTYFEMLEPSKLFLPFTPGALVRRGENEDQRSYVFSWACYDFQTNRPYVHIMSFDQDIQQQPLEEHGGAFKAFIDAVRAEGSRAPDVGILALAIDDAIESVHPKIVKRLCIGPLYAPLLLEHSPANNEDQVGQILYDLIARHCRNESDSVLFFSDEIVFSKSQKVTRSLLAPSGKVREIFAITESDPECYSRRASVIHHHVLLPHAVLQHMSPRVEAALPRLTRCRKVTYDEGGMVEIHG